MSGSLQDKQQKIINKILKRARRSKDASEEWHKLAALSENESMHTVDNLATGLTNVKNLPLTHTCITLILSLQFIGKS